MGGSSDFRLELGPSFERSVLELEREHYRHDKKGIAEFRAELGRMLDSLFEWPRIAGLRQEPFPPKTGQQLTGEGWTFFKLEFSTPRANGKGRQGRLMFMVHQGDRLLVPVYVYTHAQFPSRVPDAPLRDLVNAATRSSQKTPIVTASPVIAVVPPPGADDDRE